MYVTQSQVSSGEAADIISPTLGRWLRETEQLDITTPKLRTRMLSLTQLQLTDRDKAVAIHDFVKSLPFGVITDQTEHTASDVLKIGHGDCFSKGMLMVALLRCAGVPARLRFVSLPMHFLRGLIDAGDSSIVHALAEVWIEGNWVTTDTYVPDEAMQLAAITRLAHENRDLGYGVHRRGSVYWLGKKDASAQCHAGDDSSLPTVDWGVADDPKSFYSDPSHSELRRNFVTRIKWLLAAPLVNKRVATLRHGNA
jgi:Transglutaminase-like superfamily